MSDVAAVVFDLHGVLQEFRNEGAAEGEKAAHLPAGTIARFAYDHPTYEMAKVGLMTDEQWAQGVADRLRAEYGARVRHAIGPWRADRGHPVPAMIDLLGQVRRAGVPCAILSNFTDAMHTDLDRHGIHADHPLASADLGVTKPSRFAYREAADRIGFAPSRILFFDDQEAYVAGARAAGMHAELFTTPSAVATRLAA
ncbi:HAD-IA family hydrolase, partial [Kitasatospora sp. NPDC001574]